MKYLEMLLEAEKRLVSKIINNKTYLKLVAVFIAIVLFIAINGTGIFKIDQYFENKETIEGINLRVDAAENKIISGLPQTVAVTAQGSASQIKNFAANKNNVVGTVDISVCKGKDGSCTINSDNISFSNNAGVKVKTVTDNFTIDIDTKTTVTYPVEVLYINQEANPGLILETPEPSVSSITFDVGMHKKDEIGSVKEIIDLSKITDVNASDYTFAAPVKVYDKEGNVLDTHTSLPTIDIKQPYKVGVQTKVVKYRILNNKTGKYVSDICSDKPSKTCSDTVEVYGQDDKISEIDSITYDVDLSNVDENNLIINAQPSLDSGVHIKGDPVKKVHFKLEKGVERTFKGIPITITNLNYNFETPAIKNGTTNVTIKGAASVVNALKDDEIMVYIDAKNINKAETVELPLQKDLKNQIQSGTLSIDLDKKTVKVEFKQKD